MVIKSILDTDLYKFTTSYAYMKLFPQARGTFEFIDRNNEVYDEEFLEALRIELYNIAQLRLTKDEFDWACSIRFIPLHYWEWLRSFHFNADKIQVHLDKDGHLRMKVTDHLYKVTLYETVLLQLVSELRNKHRGYAINMGKLSAELMRKSTLANVNGLFFSDFSSRRRFSFNVQEQVVKFFSGHVSAGLFTGTSNCHLAMKYGLTPIGTHPHEWFMFHGAMYGYKHANYMALENWVNVYDGDLGIALTDTYTSEVFFTNFSRKHAKLFDGIRQDSGDPYRFITKAVARYRELGIDPSTKTIIFSNSLTFEEAISLREACRGRCKGAAGIGGNLVNDRVYFNFDYVPANIVMKLTSCQMNENQPWQYCVKLSDDEGKHTGRVEDVEHCKIDLNLCTNTKE